jgi:Nucleotidyltransferase substrate binding protein like
MLEDIRWKQRFENFDKAFHKLCIFAEMEKQEASDVHQVALIGAFKFTFKLGWKTLKDYLAFSGVEEVLLPRDVISKPFIMG